MKLVTAVACLSLVLAGTVSLAQSVYTSRPDDAHAVYLDAPEFHAHGDGVADDSAALQQAIDRVQETVHHGIVLVPPGRYRLTRTIHVWAGIRLIGYGAQRPVFMLAPKTPGFQQGDDRYMLWFTDERPNAGDPIPDASEFTFFSAVSNIDFSIGDGNPAAVAVRFNVAQHSFVSHANFEIGTARAALEQIGNQASDIHVHGGQFGIVTGKTSPAWQFLLMDSSFDGQSVAAIRTQEAGMTLVRDRFTHAPTAIEIPEGQVEQLYGRDLELRAISGTAFKLGDVRNLRSETTLEHVICKDVRQFATGAESVAGGASLLSLPHSFVEDRLTLGLEIGSDGRETGVALTHHERAMQAGENALQTDVPALPATETWVNVRTLGVKGDGGTDDTAALQHAIDTHATLYLPSGRYRLTGSLHLRRDTVLIGLHPFATELVLPDSDPHFAGSGAAIPLLLAPSGGRTIVTGIGIATGNNNPRAAGVEWLAGAQSMLEDVDFIRGRSERVAALDPAAPPAPAEAMKMQLDQQYPSLWIHNGGGGVFRGIWSHAGTAKAGLVIEDTDTPGAIYQFSCEHHMRDEVRIARATHWHVYDLQTEEENPEGADAVAMELEHAHDVLFANTYMYRVSRNVLPKPYAVVARDASDVSFANVKVFSQTRLAFDNTVFDEGSGVEVRAHHFVHFGLKEGMHPGAPLALPATFAPGTHLERLATGFSNASGLTADSTGDIYFTDAARHRIYRYDEQNHSAVVLAETSESPMVLGFAAPATLLAINNERSVSSVDIPSGTLTQVQESEQAKPNTVLLLPTGLHNELDQLDWLLEGKGYVYSRGSNTAVRSALLPQPRGYFYAPGSNVAIFAGGTWRPLLQSAQLEPFTPGTTRYVTSEYDERTWLGTFQPGAPLATQLFLERGGTSVVTDNAGNVYLADGQVRVFDRNGTARGVLEIPERPSSLCLGGADGRTLFIGARGSLYAIQLAAPGK